MQALFMWALPNPQVTVSWHCNETLQEEKKMTAGLADLDAKRCFPVSAMLPIRD